MGDGNVMFIGCEIGTLGWVLVLWTFFFVFHGRMLAVNDEKIARACESGLNTSERYGMLDREYLFLSLMRTD